MTNNYILSIFLPIILSLLFSIFFIPILQNSSSNIVYSFNTKLNTSFNSSNNNILKIPTNTIIKPNYNFLWPTPGYKRITSKFGTRTAPTTGAGTYHGGIDIGAPENTSIISIADGQVTFAGWNGANGYTIIISHSNNIKSIYGHVSPIFLVSVGDNVKKGDLIAKVGPKYIEKKEYTNYKDNTGKYTNGATTRSSPTFFYK